MTTTSQAVNEVRIVRLKVWLMRVVDHLIGQMRRLPLDLADPVEDDDRVVDREADQGQECRDDRQVDLELVDLENVLRPGILASQ